MPHDLKQRLINFFKMPNKILYNIRNSKKGFFEIFRLMPNIITLSSLCITLTAVRFSMVSEYVLACSLLLFAGFLDGMDGRLARFLNSSSDFGAQLDSLVDFVNFGVVPGFIVYFWINSYGDIFGLDWAMVLIYAVCAAIRLARFNVDLNDKKTNPIIQKYFFKGIPSPVGAALTTLPLVLFFEFGQGFYCNQILVIVYIFILAVMMASRVPTISIKKIPIKNGNLFLTSLILGSIIFGLIVKPWLTLAIIGIVYVLSIPITIYYFIKISNS
ncbi:MAG: phosphatidylcholine/phosphatidylserine synthase [Proteobacteria bacterium]|nr:phosphatidylcholine/phosphatidylserine synthase [Pseudomonadota bacterium]